MTSRARILALVTDAFGGYGGISRYNRDFLTALAAADSVEEIVALPRHGDAADEPLPPRVRQLPPVPNKIRYSLAALDIARRGGPFHIVFCGHLLMAPLAEIVAAWQRVPTWLQLHGIDAWDRPAPLVQRAAERSTLVTVVSRYTKRRFLGWADLEPEKVKVLPNTVSDRFSPGPKSSSLMERFGLSGRRVLLTISRLAATDWYKGHNHVISVLPELLRDMPDLVYVIAGTGDNRQKLDALAAQLGVSGAVRFIGRIDDALLPDLYRIADVFVMPSTKEGFGIVFLEALKSGIAVIGGNADGSVDPLGDGHYGWAIDCGSREQLTRAIRDALQRPPKVPAEIHKFDRRHFEMHCERLLLACLGSVTPPDVS